jgi:hypothetical protein
LPSVKFSPFFQHCRYFTLKNRLRALLISDRDESNSGGDADNDGSSDETMDVDEDQDAAETDQLAMQVET